MLILYMVRAVQWLACAVLAAFAWCSVTILSRYLCWHRQTGGSRAMTHRGWWLLYWVVNSLCSSISALIFIVAGKQITCNGTSMQRMWLKTSPLMIRSDLLVLLDCASVPEQGFYYFITNPSQVHCWISTFEFSFPWSSSWLVFQDNNPLQVVLVFKGY